MWKLSYGECMKKINFISFFSQEKESSLDRIIATTTITLVIMYLSIIVAVHTMQGYKWYQLSVQKSNYNNQAVAFDSIVTKRSELQKSKEKLQDKINYFKQQKKDQLIINNQLNTFYFDGSVFLKTISINDYQFELSFETKTVRQAYQFLKELKAQPLIYKARIIHLSKVDSAYVVSIKGKFKKH